MALFALHDYDPKLKERGAIDITKKYLDIKQIEDIAQRGNRKGYGIFWVVNDFKGARKKENLTKINYWFCDIDEGSKEEQLKRIEALSIPPSFVVETQKGYHCYWGVNGSATLENFTKIEERLIELLKGDKACKDPLRLLRAPYYYHMKNPAKPFLVHIVEGLGSEKDYTEGQMFNWLCREKQPPKTVKRFNSKKSDFLDETKWEKIFKISDIYNGNRNGTLTRYTFWLKDEGLASDEIEYIIRGINNKLIEPLPDRELNALLRSKLR